MDDFYDVAACPACGDAIDYCRGHGPLGDPAGAAILSAHDGGDHGGCHPAGCDDAAEAAPDAWPVRSALPADADYCRGHDMFRPCAWCPADADAFNMARATADRGATTAPAAVLLALLAACGPGPVGPVGPGPVAPTTAAPTTAPTTAPAPVAEDDAGWDCATMGNRVCGPVRVVLGPDGAAEVFDNPPPTVTDDDLWAVLAPAAVTYGPADPMARPCGAEHTGPRAVTVWADGPAAVAEGATMADVWADGPGGRCSVAVATVLLY